MFRWIVIVSIFISIFISSYIFFRYPFEFYISYVVFIALFPIFFVKYGVPRAPVLLFIPILIAGVTYCAIGLNTYGQFFKIFIGFFSSVLFYHYVVELFNFDLKLLFKYYMKASYIMALIGIFQLLSFWIGFRYGYDFRWLLNKWGFVPGGLGIRVNALFSEPSYFAATIAPAFFVSVYNWTAKDAIFITRRTSLIIIVAYLITFSSLGILGIFLTVLLLLINFGFVRYAIVFIPLAVVVFKYSYENVDEFRDRYDSTIEIFSSGNYSSYDINGSSFVLYNNYHVALENFKRNPFFGTGLGSHPVAFDKYSLTNLEGAVEIDFNKMDANSMLLRLMSETGLYGLFIYLFLLVKCWIFKKATDENEVWVMSNGLAAVIILYLIRQGHYFLNGFPFFVWMYYYVAKDNWKKRDEKLLKTEKERFELLASAANRKTLRQTT
ncbi:MAG: hypothetical protein R2809_13455 [Flavobacteriales bacterium]